MPLNILGFDPQLGQDLTIDQTLVGPILLRSAHCAYLQVVGLPGTPEGNVDEVLKFAATVEHVPCEAELDSPVVDWK